MTSAIPSNIANRLLRALSVDDFERLAPHLRHVKLAKGEQLVEDGDDFEYAWFLESGLGSVVAQSPEGDSAEIGMYGYEGMAGIPVVLGTIRSDHNLFMQVGGEGLRIPTRELRAAMAERPAINSLLLAYVQYFLVQVAQTTVSNGVHTVEERLGRWLLMAHDRLGDEIPLTHEYLALMLAVRRPSVTTALQTLESAGYIRGTRGVIHMRDREGLECFAAAAYGRPEETYARLIGPLR